MSGLFVNSGWKYNGIGNFDPSVGVAGMFSVTASMGVLHLISDFNEDVNFGFGAVGGGVGLSKLAVDFSAATQKMDSVGVVYANSALRKSLSVDDFTGPCLIYSAAATLMEGGKSSALMFFNLGKQIVAGWMAFVASGGLAGPVIVPTIIASCSAMVACTGNAFGTPQAGISGFLGNVDIGEGQRGSEILCAYPWRVTANGKDYSYIFHEDGRCYWYEYKDFQFSPDGNGMWSVISEVDSPGYVEIRWESGSKEKWNLPISLTAQTGIWQTKETKVFNIYAKYDLIKMTLIYKTLNL